LRGMLQVNPPTWMPVPGVFMRQCGTRPGVSPEPTKLEFVHLHHCLYLQPNFEELKFSTLGQKPRKLGS
jgi:hypothetical protein